MSSSASDPQKKKKEKKKEKEPLAHFEGLEEAEEADQAKFKFSDLPKIYQSLQKAIIRPPRFRYKERILGDKEFMLGGMVVQRTDLELTNPRGLKLVCSHWQPAPEYRVEEKLPCVVYGHGNCGSRLDALESIETLLPANISVFAMDFAGSGNSEGEYVTLGYFEQHDVATAVNHLRETGTVSTIGLWGRSMGAMSCILYGASDPSIAGMVLDSSFTSFKGLATEIVKGWSKYIPKFGIGAGLMFINRSVKKKSKMDIHKVNASAVAPKTFIPAIFAHGEQDDFISAQHSKDLAKIYGGDHNLVLFEGDHNSARPGFFLDSTAIFFQSTLWGDAEVPQLTAEKRKAGMEAVRARGGKPAPRFNPFSTNAEDQLAALLAPANSQALAAQSAGSNDDDLALEDEEERQMMAAIAASLEASNNDGSGSTSPGTRSDDEDMIAAALAMSLNDSEPAGSPTLPKPPTSPRATTSTSTSTPDIAGREGSSPEPPPPPS